MSTALIPLLPIDREAPVARASGRPRADFVAQLIATSGKAPQACARRRAAPKEAMAAYSALCRRPTMAGERLSRSL